MDILQIPMNQSISCVDPSSVALPIADSLENERSKTIHSFLFDALARCDVALPATTITWPSIAPNRPSTHEDNQVNFAFILESNLRLERHRLWKVICGL
jgi:hypothetical protein